MSGDLQGRIRDLAYLMWESAGRQQGMAMDFWLQAEQEIVNTVQKAARTATGATGDDGKGKTAKTAKPRTSGDKKK